VSEPPEDARRALERRARTSPETPFLFFRSPRGTFTWWSCARAAFELRRELGRDPEPVAGSERERVPRELVTRLGDALDHEHEGARELLRSLGGAEREIWISTRSLERKEERTLALAATLADWAIVREPGERLHPALLLWARPTLVSGGAAELVELFTAAAAEAPRFRRDRWLRRRLARLGTVLVESGAGEPALAAVASSLSALGAAPRVLPFPRVGW
jgi:hypothetical protein